VKGNTCSAVPEYFSSQLACEIVHGSSLCHSDNIDIVLFAAGCGTILTSTAMDSIESSEVYFRNSTAADDPLTYLPIENGQWLWLLRNGCIAEVSCYNEEPFTLQHDFHFAISGTSHRQQFCIGLVTAKCEGHTFLQSDDQERWDLGYGRSITKNMKAGEKCTKSPKYLRRSLFLSAVADHYRSFMIPIAEFNYEYK